MFIKHGSIVIVPFSYVHYTSFGLFASVPQNVRRAGCDFPSRRNAVRNSKTISAEIRMINPAPSRPFRTIGRGVHGRKKNLRQQPTARIFRSCYYYSVALFGRNNQSAQTPRHAICWSSIRV